MRPAHPLTELLEFETEGFLKKKDKPAASTTNYREFRRASRPHHHHHHNHHHHRNSHAAAAAAAAEVDPFLKQVAVEIGHETVIVDSVSAAFETVTAQKFLVFIILMTYLSITCLIVAIPTMSSVPGGFYDNEGMFKFISIGFKQHSALASFIWGICTTFIVIVRFIGIVMYVRSPRLAILYSILLTVTVGAGIVTVRYDEVIDMHFAAAGIWIGSSLVFYGTVGAFNRAYSSVNGGRGMKIIWGANVITALMFLAFIIQYNANGRKNPGDFTAAGVNEYITAFLILVMDFILAFSIHTRFLHSADLLSNL